MTLLKWYLQWEMNILEKYTIIIGESGVGGLGNPVSTTVLLYIGYTGADGEVIKKRGRVLIPSTGEDYNKYRKAVKSYQIIQILGDKVERDNSDSPDFEVEQILNLSAEPTVSEKSFLENEQAEVKFNDEKFGEFVLNKSVDWFEGKITLNDKNVRVTLDKKENISTLYKIEENSDDFIDKASGYAAQKLLDLGNEWYEDAWEEDEGDFIPLTIETFKEKISLDIIEVSDDGEFEFWYNDGDIFWGHVICVRGTIKDGFTYASMEG